MLSNILIASGLESLMALVGIFFIFVGYDKFKRKLPSLISFSTGTFLAVVFLEIFPEALEQSGAETVFSFALIGLLAFFLFSRFLHWYHHHEACCEEHNTIKVGGYLVLAGDFIHNFIDGIIIALAFMTDVNLGIVTTVAVLFHEFPQEASDFFVLINSGFTRKKALLLNFFVSLSTVVGAVLAYMVASKSTYLIGPALGITAGNFLYIALSDLIPELEHHAKTEGTIKQFSYILLGVMVIFITGRLISH